MARRSQCSSAGDNPLDPNYLPPHYREEYRLAIDALVEEDLEGYYDFLQSADVVDFLSTQEIEHIKHTTQEPHQSSTQPESPLLETRGDGSSDTYWPLHSDLDAPGLDLGWPPQHRFIGPTEVTTLVNPSEPDMPSIKEQARRLIKNAQQVVAVVMDIFTDVDIFADILDAARRNVAVYLLLDEQNVHHFTNMVSSCRVNLMHIPFMRVRTVSGLTYYCRSGKSFKGQMMDRFLLTDCRAVLSGNYSFMWSFEKIHRCIAHLFLGQLVTTFDEEFRILFAQSQPLILEVAPAPKPMFSSMSDRQYSTDRITAPKQGIVPLFRDPRKFLERARHSFEERVDMDHRRMPLGKHHLIHRSLDQGQLEMYGDQYSSQQVRMDPSVIEQGHHMMPPNTMDSDAFKRHSYAEGLPSYQFTQPQHQAMQRFETQGRQLHREQHREQPPSHRVGPHPDYGGYEFRGCGYPTMGQYSEAEYPQDMEPDSYDHVLNYLASTSAAEMDDISDKVATEEVPFDQRSAGEPYAHQNSQIQQNSPEQKLFFQAPSTEHSKDLSGKLGLRDWRISSYLSALDDTGEEGLPAEPCGTEAFEEPPQPLFNLSQVKPLSAVPADNRFRTKELPKILTVPRMSHLHCYNKPIVPGHIKTLPVDIVTMETEPKITPTSASESSSTTEDDKTEEMEAKEPKGVQRQDSFRKRYNAAVQRSSRLRSSLIFSSQLEQNFSPESENTPDERTAKNEDDQSKLSFTSHLLGKHRSIAREPFEWSRYVKSAAADGTTAESSNSDDLVHDAGVKELQKSHPEVKHIKEQPKPVEAEQTEVSPSVHPATQSQDNQLKTIQPTHQELVSWTSFLDMNDPDNRLMFFRELAAQRKAAKADELERSAEKAHMKPDLSVTPSEPNVPASVPATSTDPERKPATTLPSQEVKSNMSMPTSHRNVTEQASSCEELDLNPPREECEAEPLLDCHVCSNEGAGSGSTDAEKIELKKSQSGKAQMKQDPATPDMPSEDCSLIDLKESDVSKSTLNRTAEREYSPPSCSETSSPTNAPSETSPLSPHLSTQEPSPESPATMTPNSSNPLSSSGALLSPTPKDSSSDNKGSSIGLNPALKDSSSSIPISNEELIPSKPAELIDNTQTMSSTSSGSSSSTYPSPSEAPASPTPVPSATSSSPQPVPSEPVLSPQTILSEFNSSQAVPSESGSTTPTGPIQSSLSLGQNELAFPSKPEENEANKSHSPTLTKSPPRTNSGESSLPKPASDEFIVSLEPPQTEPPLTSPPPAVMKSETSSSLQPIQSEPVTSPVLSEVSSSKTAPSEPSPITSTITQQSKSNESHSPSPTSLSTEIKRGESSTSEPGQVESVLSYKPPQTESSSSSQPNPMESTSSNLSLSSSNYVTDESNIFPSPCQEDTSSPLNPITTESCSSPKLGPDQSVLLTEPEKDEPVTSPCQEDASSPLNPITTESCSSPKLGPDQSALLTEPEKDKPVTFPNLSPEPSSEKTLPSPDLTSESDDPPKTDPTSLTAEEVCTSSVSGSDSVSLVSPKSDKTEVVSTSPCPSSPSDKSTSLPEPTSAESSESFIPKSTELCSPSMHTLVECTSSVLTECNSRRDSSAEFITSEPPVSVEKSNEGTPADVSRESKPESSVLNGESKAEEVEAKETANKAPEASGCHGSQSDETKMSSSTMSPPESSPDQVSPLSPQSKNSKASPSRYASSTAKVISSSNLRDDTKLLLGQISANSQSRTELLKQSAVTDDDKEDKTQKGERGEGEALDRSQLKHRGRTPEERENLLQRIQSMRKERKVYSRFEMAP